MKQGFVQSGFVLIGALITTALLSTTALILSQKVAAVDSISVTYAPNNCESGNVPTLLNWNANPSQNMLTITYDNEYIKIPLDNQKASATRPLPPNKNVKFQIGIENIQTGYLSSVLNETQSQTPACQSPQAQTQSYTYPTPPIQDQTPQTPTGLGVRAACKNGAPVWTLYWNSVNGVTGYLLVFTSTSGLAGPAQILGNSTSIELQNVSQIKSWQVGSYTNTQGRTIQSPFTSPQPITPQNLDCQPQPTPIPTSTTNDIAGAIKSITPTTIAPGQTVSVLVNIANTYNTGTIKDIHLEAWSNLNDTPTCTQKGDASFGGNPKENVISSWQAPSPEGITNYIYTFTAPNQAGTYKTWFFVESNCQYTESNEINNIASISYTVVSTTPAAQGAISATPNPCQITEAQSSCTSKITWNSSNARNPQVWVNPPANCDPNGHDFGNAASYSQDASWITQTPATFVLFENGCGSTILAQVSVSALAPATPQPDTSPTPTPYTTPYNTPAYATPNAQSPQPTATPAASVSPTCNQPGSFQVITPNVESASTQPTFKWTKSDGAVRYFLQLSDDRFQTYWDVPVSKDSVQTSDGQTLVYQPWPASWGNSHAAGKAAPPELKDQQTYQWRVSAINECINSQNNTQGTRISDARTVSYKKPVGPRSIEPAQLTHVDEKFQKANNIDGITVNFSWKTSSNSKELDQQWLYLKFKDGSEPNHANSINLGPFDNKVVATTVPGDNNSPGLLEDREYIWTIDTIDPTLNYQASLASPDTFKTVKREVASPLPSSSPKPGEEVCDNNIDDNKNGIVDEKCPPLKPNLIRPANGASSKEPSLDFAWNGSLNVDYYWLDISTNPNFDQWWGCQTKAILVYWRTCDWTGFKTTAAGADLSDKNPPAELPNGSYYWRVTAINDNGRMISQVFNFTIGNGTPSPTPTPQPSPTPTVIPSATPSASQIPASQSAQPSATQSPTPVPQPVCKLAAASWSTDITTDGTLVQLNVIGSSQCDGKEIKFDVFKNNPVSLGLVNGKANTQPQPATFIGTSAQTSWNAEYQPAGPFGIFDPPQYFFKAYVTNNNKQSEIRSAEPLLTVYKSCEIISASWDRASATDGNTVTLTVKGNYACTDKEVSFKIRENNSVLEGGIDRDAKSNATNAKFPPKITNIDSSSGPLPPTITATTTWRAEYMQDGPLGIFDPPEYYFYSQIVGQNNVTRSSGNLLKVTKGISTSQQTEYLAGPTQNRAPSPTPIPIKENPIKLGGPSIISTVSTAVQSQIVNLAPATPAPPQGVTSGTIAQDLQFTFSGSDPDGDPISLYIDWGDNTITSISQASVSTKHSFQTAGTYNVKVKAIEANSPFKESAWSQSLQIVISGVQSNCVNITTNGNSSTKLDVTFLPVKYTQADIPLFADDVNEAIKSLLFYSPFDEKRTVFNFHRIDKTDFNLDLNKWIILQSDIITKAANDCPTDQIILIVNDANYHGAGDLGMASVGRQFNRQYPTDVVHEFGHSFAELADEYVYDPPVSAPYIQNPVNCSKSQTQTIWGSFPGTSTFQGCSAPGWFRPTQSSMMKDMYGNAGRRDAFDSWNIKVLTDKLNRYNTLGTKTEEENIINKLGSNIKSYLND